jgi:hypothetical protein
MSNLHRGHFIDTSYQVSVVAMFVNRLEGSIYMYGRFCIKFPQSRMKGEFFYCEHIFESVPNNFFIEDIP